MTAEIGVQKKSSFGCRTTSLARTLDTFTLYPFFLAFPLSLPLVRAYRISLNRSYAPRRLWSRWFEDTPKPKLKKRPRRKPMQLKVANPSWAKRDKRASSLPALRARVRIPTIKC